MFAGFPKAAIPTTAALLCILARADIPVVDLWRYTTEAPAQDWYSREFNDHDWQLGYGGFGTPHRDRLRVDTPWDTEHIWLRKEIPIASVPDSIALYICNINDAVVYINGQKVAELPDATLNYRLIPLSAEHASLLHPGSNVLAVHCRNQRGIQFIDAHLVLAGEEPTLPPTRSRSVPYDTALTTQWGKQVTPENAWLEYPRPQMRRAQWQNLNGTWAFAITPLDQHEPPQEWDGTITVPFPLESKLGGVQRLLQPYEALWYRRAFEVPETDNLRTLLNFEAVDYRCSVWVNGVHIGSHQGGNTPFSLDATESIRPGQNDIVVRVEDATEEWQLRGKQVLQPRGIWYTRVSGIWQTVWLEQVPAQHIQRVTIHTKAEAGSIAVRVDTAGNASQLRVQVIDGAEVVAAQHGPTSGVQLIVPEPTLWTPDTPHLYDLEIALLDDAGAVVDSVTSYAGIRTVGTVRDESGHLRFTLNGDEIFHWGTLDQGWWPDGLLTPPSDEAMRSDIEFLKAAGFNMIRKHIKIEPRRYYYHADRIGMMIWQDQPSAGNGPPWVFLRADPEDADWPNEHHQQFMWELDQMVTTLESHPSIVVWVPFNEAWGQHRTMQVGQWLVERDPGRLVNIASGGNFWPVGHIVDAHAYPEPNFPFEPDRFDDYIKVIGEFGGHGFPIDGHLWNPDQRNWGYGGALPEHVEELEARYRASITTLSEFRSKGIAGGVYTQTTDVEIEINGLLTYDRAVVKIPPQTLAEIHQQLLGNLTP